MKANEFFKKFGLEYAKHILTDDALLIMDLNYNDLKRLVESHELVWDYGGLEKSRLKVQGNRLSYKKTAALWEAIADVESCQ